MYSKKIDPRILAEWDSWRCKTITTPRGVTFDLADLAQRAYAKALADFEAFQERGIDRLTELNCDEEIFRGQTSSTVETAIIIAILEAEKFKIVSMAYQKYKYELGLESPTDSGLLGMLEFAYATVRQVAVPTPAPTPVNDNVSDVCQKKKPRQKKSDQTG